MQVFTIPIGVLFLIIYTCHATPIPVSQEMSDSSLSSSEKEGIVYVFDIYAVKNSNVPSVARMLSAKSLEKLPAVFEPIGSVLVLDDEEDEPFTMEEFSEFLGDLGITVTPVGGNGSKIVEVFVDETMDDYRIMVSLEEWLNYLKSEGIMIEMSSDNNGWIFEISFDESVRLAQEQPFTLAELAEYFQEEGFEVEVVQANGAVRKIKLYVPREDNNESDKVPSTTQRTDSQVNPREEEDEESYSVHDFLKRDEKVNEIDNKGVKKVDKHANSNKIDKDNAFDKKNEAKDERDNFAQDFITRADYVNKLRRRRSACPECKVGNSIKELINRYENSH